MKLKLTDQELRLRLSRAELEQLATDGRLQQVTWLLPDRALTLVLETDAQAGGLALTWQGDRLTVSLPVAASADWVKSGRLDVRATTATGLTLRVERDLREARA